ncbi:hypothetical protein A9Q90_07955 [Gammaproteobacteria bacterium 54_18_T64]|nr:hypothetical protein A9Q90_07955 [Gammaproteobacteria bacterium 54_18_T64]
MTRVLKPAQQILALCIALSFLFIAPEGALALGAPPAGESDAPPAGQPGDEFWRPAGIYLLGVRNNLGEISDQPFIDGYVLRTGWNTIESSENTYNFDKIDDFIRALDEVDQHLSLTIFSQRVPQYILDTPGVTLYESVNQNNNGSSYTTAVPWDEIAHERYQVFMRALGDHRVWSIAADGEVPLREHPVLRVIGAQIMGLGGLRDPLNAISSQPSYSRERFTAASIDSLAIAVDEFPEQSVHVAVFGIADDVDSPPLDDHIVDELGAVFNSDEQPRLGFFAENLACDSPGIGNNYLFEQQDATFTMFQMLQAWLDPFKDPAKTDSCKTDIQGPDVAMAYALDNFNSRYFEVYPIDLNNELYAPALQDWHDFLAQDQSDNSGACPGARGQARSGRGMARQGRVQRRGGQNRGDRNCPWH